MVLKLRVLGEENAANASELYACAADGLLDCLVHLKSVEVWQAVEVILDPTYDGTALAGLGSAAITTGGNTNANGGSEPSGLVVASNKGKRAGDDPNEGKLRFGGKLFSRKKNNKASDLVDNDEKDDDEVKATAEGKQEDRSGGSKLDVLAQEGSLEDSAKPLTFKKPIVRRLRCQHCCCQHLGGRCAHALGQ